MFKFFKKQQKHIVNNNAFINSPIATYVTDTLGVITEVNLKALELSGYAHNELIGENMSIFKSNKHDNSFYKNLWTKLNEQKSFTFEVYNQNKLGEIILIKSSITNYFDNNKKYFLVTQEDITQERHLYNRHEYLATHDQLTGLANRTLLKDRYKHAVLNAKRNHTKLMIVLCDLNEFKQINDSHGHNFGDHVLKNVADNLKSVVRDVDTVARLGGDEFVVIIENLTDINSITDLMLNLKSKTNIEISKDGISCNISLSLGHAIFPQDGTTYDQLVDVADIKMYQDKNIYYGY